MSKVGHKVVNPYGTIGLLVLFFILGNSQNVLAQGTPTPAVTDTPGSTSAPVSISQEVFEKGLSKPNPQETPNFNKPDPVPPKQLGRFQTAAGGQKTAELLLDRYKQSVVRIIARDESGNELNRSMGVAIGYSSNGTKIGKGLYIATSLSLILGNALQWADKIEIQHESGTKYYGRIALIDEQIDLVLVEPQNAPQPIFFVDAQNERPQINIYTIGFKDTKEGYPEAKIHSGTLAAVNRRAGTLAVSGAAINNSQIGTGIINTQGQLVGMLLKDSNGVLSSALRTAILKAHRLKSFHPRLVGVIMGRGVLVDKRIPSAFQTIEAAIKAVNAGTAPKRDPTRYLRAYTDDFRPSTVMRPVIKVAPGTYNITNTLEIPSNISFTGSGPSETILIGSDPNKPIVSLKKS